MLILLKAQGLFNDNYVDTSLITHIFHKFPKLQLVKTASIVQKKGVCRERRTPGGKIEENKPPKYF